MSKIEAIIVDDELSARENLTYLIENFCPEINIIDTCSNVDTAVLSIKKHEPNVVFLDIEMPQKNGFQLLHEFSNNNFQIVFITAYDQYAIKAFEVSAIDYLLKPIDIDRLIEAVGRVKENIDHLNYQVRLNALNNNKEKLTKISIPYKSDYIIISIEDIMFIEADRMYSHIYTKQGKKFTASKKLSYYENVFNDNPNFKRVHRSWMINIAFVKSYSISSKEIIISDKLIPVSKTYKCTLEKILGV